MILCFIGGSCFWASGVLFSNPEWIGYLSFGSVGLRANIGRIGSIGLAIAGAALVMASFVT